MLDLLVGVAVSVALAGASLRLEMFDTRGSALAGGAGVFVTVVSGVDWLLLLILFVALGTSATRFALTWKVRRGLSEGGRGSRTGRNVLANGGVPLLVVALAGVAAGTRHHLIAVYAGAIATATADTLSSEIGVLSRSTRLITSPWTEVEPGMDGGVSALGQVWAAGGALVVAAAAALLFEPSYLVPVSLGGFLGCQADSVMGATLERRGILGNEGVNLLATATGGITALGIYGA
ncbi:MAG: hypothetical protein MAG715_00107 [Methanonatronarchaeales archaeon]|nr:hypothetical protein [Methanonatronarchaeales archaeon]